MTEATFDTGSQLLRLSAADGVGTIKVDTGKKMNPLNNEIQVAVGRAADLAAESADIAAVVLTGGPVFAAGADIKEMVDMNSATIRSAITAGHEGYNKLVALPKPVVAAVNGYALGGGLELALCADIRIMAEDAKVGVPEVTLGVVPGLGGTQRLARLIGPAKAKDMIFTGRMVGAEEALALGLVDKVLPAEEVEAAAYKWASKFVGGAALAYAAAKRAVDGGLEGSLAEGIALEIEEFSGLFDTEDQKIGMRAFVNKEKAAFTGR